MWSFFVYFLFKLQHVGIVVKHKEGLVRNYVDGVQSSWINLRGNYLFCLLGITFILYCRFIAKGKEGKVKTKKRKSNNIYSTFFTCSCSKQSLQIVS